MIMIESYRKYPRGIARVFINFIVLTRVGKGFQVFTMARVRSNGKWIWRLTQAEVVNDSGREVTESTPETLRECSLICTVFNS